jgi:L-ascorbate metabolism protein UlaG (beta-lactamase superfamily)
MTKLMALLFTAFSLFYLLTQNTYYHKKQTKNFNGKKFIDPNNPYSNSFLNFLKWQLTKEQKKWPEKIPLKITKKPLKSVKDNKTHITYVGHACFLIQINKINILTDPIWSDRASPFSFIGPKRVIEPGIKFSNLPKIDIVLISHNHYDHLDLNTINNLWKNFKPQIITPLGNDTIIKKINKNIKVTAKNWDDKVIINNNITIHIEPVQHWSARGLFDKNHALWSGFLIETKTNGNIYFAGDAGYSKYFKQTKQKFKKINIAILPIGAYKPRWFMKYAHMNPQDAIKASIDLGSPTTIPSHFDVFPLADENYLEARTTLEQNLKKSNLKNFKILNVGGTLLK